MKELSVFYDGKCHLCFREIQHYAKKDRHKKLDLIDISTSEFRAEKYGLSTREVNLHMHVKDQQGNVFKGIDAFIEIWKRIPPYHLLIPVFDNKVLRPLWLKSYDLFAQHIRPKLPKRNCENGYCSVIHPDA